MTLCPFDDAAVAHLAPLALTRAAADLRVGARTLLENAQAAFPHARLAFAVRPLVAGVVADEHPEAGPVGGPTLFVNGRWRVQPGALAGAVQQATRHGQPRAFTQPTPDGEVLVALWHPDAPDGARPESLAAGVAAETVDGAVLVARLWDVVEDLAARVAADVEAMGGLGVHDGAAVHDGARLVAPERIHLAAGAVVRAGAVVSAEDGPVHVGAGAVVSENAVVRGPCFLGPGALVKVAGRIDGSAVGPGCKVGGEVHESSLHSYSAKAHDGYLGNSALGRWCNVGAATDTSNLRNDYGEVDLWDAPSRAFLPSGRQFLGLIMGDHSKCAIHTTFNTGTVVGVSCNLFGAGFHARHVPSFTWGEPGRMLPYRIAKALAVAEAVLARRGRTVRDAERALLTALAAEAHAPATHRA